MALVTVTNQRIVRRDVQPREARHPVGHDVENHAVGDRHQGRADMPQELEGGAQIDEIVQDSDRDHERRADRNALERS